MSNVVKRFSRMRLERALARRRIEAVAAAAGVSPETIRSWISGPRTPNADTLARVAAVLGRPIGWFFERAA